MDALKASGSCCGFVEGRYARMSWISSDSKKISYFFRYFFKAEWPDELQITVQYWKRCYRFGGPPEFFWGTLVLGHCFESQLWLLFRQVQYASFSEVELWFPIHWIIQPSNKRQFQIYAFKKCFTFTDVVVGDLASFLESGFHFIENIGNKLCFSLS